MGWPWVGEFVGFIVILVYFPTQHNLVNREHPSGLTPYHGKSNEDDIPGQQRGSFYDSATLAAELDFLIQISTPRTGQIDHELDQLRPDRS